MTTQTYMVEDESRMVLGETTAQNPAVGLRKVCGNDLAEQDGRYGTLKDGRRVAALLVPRGRRYFGRGQS